MPIPRVLLLDLDGTLVDSVADLATPTNLVRADYGLPALSVSQVRALIGRGARWLLEAALRPAELREDELIRALKRYQQLALEHCLDSPQIYPGVIETLEGLSEVSLAIVTNKPEAVAMRMAHQLGLQPPCALVIGAREGRPLKPAPDMLLAALRELGASPEEAWMVGDSVHDMGAARAAGCGAVGVAYGLGDRGDLLACQPIAVVDDFPALGELVRRSRALKA